jgi:hypothetical protein
MKPYGLKRFESYLLLTNLDGCKGDQSRNMAKGRKEDKKLIHRRQRRTTRKVNPDSE